MSSKKDNRKMVDMLERMRLIKKIEESDNEVGTQQPAVTSSAAPARDDSWSNAADRAEAQVSVSHTQQAPSAPAAQHARNDAPPAYQKPTYETPNLRPAPSAYNATPTMVDDGPRDIYAPHLPGTNSYAFDRAAPRNDAYTEQSFWDETERPAQNVEGFMDIEMLYHSFGMKSGGVDTIFLIEEYIRTLPDSLPAELRRSIITKIVTASGFDFDALLSDGIERVSRLNEYAATFAARSDELISRYTTEIQALEAQIERVQEVIAERKNLHKSQFLAIEDEAQRLKDVLDFATK